MSIIEPADKAQRGARIAPGVYFGMQDATYHADPALGSGDMRALAKCPMFYWRDSHMNPLRDEEPGETPQLLFGRALHKLVLEGRAAFEASYTAAPKASDFPGCLDTMDHLKDTLRTIRTAREKALEADTKLSTAERKEALKAVKAETALGGDKPDLIARVKALDPAAVIFADIMAAHTAKCGKTVTSLPQAMFARVVLAAQHISSNEEIRSLLSGGRPEVAVFWESDGVPCKAKLDYVRLGRAPSGRVAGYVTDLKSFGNPLEKRPEEAVIGAIGNYRLDQQAAHYLDGIRRIPEMIAAGIVFGADTIKPEWLGALSKLGADDWVWNWAFYQSDAPIALKREMSVTGAMARKAAQEIAAARAAYVEHMTAFGTDWRYVDPMRDKSVDLDDMPAWLANAA